MSICSRVSRTACWFVVSVWGGSSFGQKEKMLGVKLEVRLIKDLHLAHSNQVPSWPSTCSSGRYAQCDHTRNSVHWHLHCRSWNQVLQAASLPGLARRYSRIALPSCLVAFFGDLCDMLGYPGDHACRSGDEVAAGAGMGSHCGHLSMVSRGGDA